MGLLFKHSYDHFLIHDEASGRTISYLVSPKSGDISNELSDDEKYVNLAFRENMIWYFINYDSFLNTCFLKHDYMDTLYRKFIYNGDNPLCNTTGIFGVLRFVPSSRIMTRVPKWHGLSVEVNGVMVLDIVREPCLCVYLYSKLIPMSRMPKRKTYEPQDFYNKYILKRDRYSADKNHIMC